MRGLLLALEALVEGGVSTHSRRQLAAAICTQVSNMKRGLLPHTLKLLVRSFSLFEGEDLSGLLLDAPSQPFRRGLDCHTRSRNVCNVLLYLCNDVVASSACDVMLQGDGARQVLCCAGSSACQPPSDAIHRAASGAGAGSPQLPGLQGPWRHSVGPNTCHPGA